MADSLGYPVGRVLTFVYKIIDQQRDKQQNDHGGAQFLGVLGAVTVQVGLGGLKLRRRDDFDDGEIAEQPRKTHQSGVAKPRQDGRHYDGQKAVEPPRTQHFGGFQQTAGVYRVQTVAQTLIGHGHDEYAVDEAEHHNAIGQKGVGACIRAQHRGGQDDAVERSGDQAEQLHHLFQPRQVDDDHIQGQQYADIGDDHRHKGDEQPAPDAK